MTQMIRPPKNRSSRLSDDIWLISEAFNRHYKTDNIRVAMESALRIAADKLAAENEKFAAHLNDVKEEGIEND